MSRQRTPIFSVPLPEQDRAYVAEGAERLGVHPTEFVRRVIVAYREAGANAPRLPEKNVLTRGRHRRHGQQEVGAA